MCEWDKCSASRIPQLGWATAEGHRGEDEEVAAGSLDAAGSPPEKGWRCKSNDCVSPWVRVLEHSNPVLGASILALHVVEITSIILTLIVVLRKTSKIALSGNRGRSKGRPPAQPITLGVSDVRGTGASSCSTSHNTARIGDTATGTYVLRDDRGGITVGAPLRTILAARHASSERTWRIEHRQSRGVGGLGSK